MVHMRLDICFDRVSPNFLLKLHFDLEFPFRRMCGNNVANKILNSLSLFAENHAEKNERRENSWMLTINTYILQEMIRCRFHVNHLLSNIQLIALMSVHTSAPDQKKTSHSHIVSIDAVRIRLLPRGFGPSCIWCVPWICTCTNCSDFFLCSV